MDELPPTTKPILIIALIVILLTGWIIWHDTPVQPLNGNLERLSVGSTAIIGIGYEVEPIIRDVIECESGWNPTAVGDNGKAYGWMQFWEGTFNQFKKMYDMEWLEYRNSQHQVILGTKMINDGYGSHWTCFRNLTRI